MTTSITKFGQHVRKLARQRHLSLAALARKLGMSRASLYQLMSGTWGGGRGSTKVGGNGPAMKALLKWLATATGLTGG
jgi:transcriptional regulator with XRE-family HTH domain